MEWALLKSYAIGLDVDNVFCRRVKKDHKIVQNTDIATVFKHPHLFCLLVLSRHDDERSFAMCCDVSATCHR